MKLALLSDIHGNLVALDAVLTGLADEDVDQIICLGDVAIFGPQPQETLARIRTLNCPVIMGNTDAWALDPSPHQIRDDETERVNAVELWGAAQLDENDRSFIRTFQPVLIESLLGGVSLCCYHGSPRSYNDPIRATTPDDELNTMLAGHSATVMVGGHTHVPMVRRFNDMLLVNPGSVGCWMTRHRSSRYQREFTHLPETHAGSVSYIGSLGFQGVPTFVVAGFRTRHRSGASRAGRETCPTPP